MHTSAICSTKSSIPRRDRRKWSILQSAHMSVQEVKDRLTNEYIDVDLVQLIVDCMS